MVVVCTESGAREIEDTGVCTAGPEAPTLDEPEDEDEITEGDDSVALEASGSADGFDANTVAIAWYAEPEGGGTPVLLDSDSDADGGWTGTWDASALEVETSWEVYAVRTVALHQGGTTTLESDRATVEIVEEAPVEVPTPTLVAPTEGQVILVGEKIPCEADPGGEVDKVEWLATVEGIGTVSFGEATEAPWELESDPALLALAGLEIEVFARNYIGEDFKDSDPVSITVTDKIWERIPGHAAAFRSDLGVTVDGTNVTNVASQGGTVGGNLAQANASNQPTYNATDANWGGRPSISHSDTMKELGSDQAAGAWKFLHDGTGSTILLVCRPNATSGNRKVLRTHGSDTAVGAVVYHIAGNDRFTLRCGNGSATVINIPAAATAPEGANYALLWTLDATDDPDSSVYYPLDTLAGTADAAGAFSDSDPTLALTIGTEGLDWVEIVAWPFSFDSTQRALCDAYANAMHEIGS